MGIQFQISNFNANDMDQVYNSVTIEGKKDFLAILQIGFGDVVVTGLQGCETDTLDNRTSFEIIEHLEAHGFFYGQGSDQEILIKFELTFEGEI